MKDKYSSYFNHKIINDPIYGSVSLSELEIRLLDTAAMQRLRRIRQMGFSSYVFPGGEHSRFVHSIGVLYIMGCMCDVLYQNNEMSFEDVKKLRIAALLHDVGHYPFSHLSECVYSFIDEEENSLINNIEDINMKSSLLSRISNHKKRKNVNHEHLGAQVINKDPEILGILNNEKIDAKEISQIITGEIKPTNSIVYAQLMHSNLDADRMDYLLRDSAQAGVVFGKVDFNYIINNLKLTKYKMRNLHEEEIEIEIIAINEKAKHAVEHFLISRYFHYVQTIQHKVSVAFEGIVKSLLYKMLNGVADTVFYKRYQSLVDKIGTEEFYQFTDDFFWLNLKEFIKISDDPLAERLWKIISKRQKPKNVIFIKDIIPKQKNRSDKKPVGDAEFFLIKWIMERKQFEIAALCNFDVEQMGYISTSLSLETLPSFMKIEECRDFEEESLRDAIKIIDRNGKVTFLASDKTSLINKMVDYTSESLDVFLLDNENNIDAIKVKETIYSLIR